jgi:6-phosphofructokinase
MRGMHIGILTGGGDCPGLNAVIRAATLELLHAVRRSRASNAASSG